MSGAFGAFVALPSEAPPPVRSSVPAFAASSGSGPGPVGASGSLTPPGLLRVSGEDEYPVPAPRRSKAWIGVGVLLAAALGGVLGMAAFRLSAGSAPRPRAATVAVPSSATSVTVTSAGPAASASAGAVGAALDRVVTLRLTSEPSGANVREDALELCAATPCDVTFRGDGADPSRTHRLVFSHLGFRPELKVIRPTDPPLHVKLLRGSWGARPGATSATSKPASSDAAPSGFKDLPY
jgi:serine/threonine-protein kinase